MDKLLIPYTNDMATFDLKIWCNKRDTRVEEIYSCAEFNFSGKPFWAIICKLFSFSGKFNGVYGFNITSKEVKFIGKMEGYDKDGA